MMAARKDMSLLCRKVLGTIILSTGKPGTFAPEVESGSLVGPALTCSGNSECRQEKVVTRIAVRTDRWCHPLLSRDKCVGPLLGEGKTREGFAQSD